MIASSILGKRHQDHGFVLSLKKRRHDEVNLVNCGGIDGAARAQLVHHRNRRLARLVAVGGDSRGSTLRQDDRRAGKTVEYGGADLALEDGALSDGSFVPEAQKRRRKSRRAAQYESRGVNRVRVSMTMDNLEELRRDKTTRASLEDTRDQRTLQSSKQAPSQLSLSFSSSLSWPRHERKGYWNHWRLLPSIGDGGGRGGGGVDLRESVMSLSSCHMEQYHGKIGLGTPSQFFTVAIDTSSTDFWIPSIDCVLGDSECDAFESLGWNFYDRGQSSTYRDIGDDGDGGQDRHYEVKYHNGDSILGMVGSDNLQLGVDSSDAGKDAGLLIVDQVFVQALNVTNYRLCDKEEGVLGLGFPPPEQKLHRKTSVSRNLRSVLTVPILGLYLDKRVDIGSNLDGADLAGEIAKEEVEEELEVEVEVLEEMLGLDDDEVKKELGMENDMSQIVFGGVNHRLYEGCLHWHDRAIHYLGGRKERETLDAIWHFELDDVRAGGMSVLYRDGLDEDQASSSPSPLLAVLDTSSAYLVGPHSIVRAYAAANGGQCVTLTSDGSSVEEVVDCLEAKDGFDAIFVDCNDDDGGELGEVSSSFHALEFVADGATYSFDRDEIVDYVMNEITGEVFCVLKIIAASFDRRDDTDNDHGSSNVWVLGTPFFQKYYTAYDLEGGGVGIAAAAGDGGRTGEPCDVDLSLDVGGAVEDFEIPENALSQLPTKDEELILDVTSKTLSTAPPPMSPAWESEDTASAAVVEGDAVKSNVGKARFAVHSWVLSLSAAAMMLVVAIVLRMRRRRTASVGQRGKFTSVEVNVSMRDIRALEGVGYEAEEADGSGLQLRSEGQFI